jgi:GTP-binding protein HflX
LLSAFRATLEEISESTLLIHLVDASNPRFEQQIESVERILRELKISEIPSIVALNKTDLVGADLIEAISKQVARNGARDVVAISALDSATLRPLLEKAGSILARNLATPPADQEHQVTDERLSRIA